jgi:hypothetical protein
MVGAALDIPDHLLSGDVDVGNLATAETLNRPMSLMIEARQAMWASYLRGIFQYVMRASVRAPRGVLSGSVSRDSLSDREVLVTRYESTVSIRFGSAEGEDVSARIASLVSAATLDGKANAGTLPTDVLVRELATALGLEGVDEIVAAVTNGERNNESLAEAIKELKVAISG